MQAKTLLPEAFSILEARKKRAERHRHVRMEETHRLLKLAEEAGAAVDAAERGPLSEGDMLFVPTIARAELELHVGLLDEASRRHDWAHLRAGCVDASYYDHLVLTLALRRVMLQNWQWPTDLVCETGERRVPDLLVKLPMTTIAVEVKTKEALKDPHAGSNLDGFRLVRDALQSSGGASRGQLAYAPAGILAIGGYFIQHEEIKRLHEGAAEWFIRNPERKRMLAAVLVSSFRARHKGNDFFLQPALEVDVIKNPHFQGDLALVVRQQVTIPYPQNFARWNPSSLERRELRSHGWVSSAALNESCPCQSGKLFRNCHGA